MTLRFYIDGEQYERWGRPDFVVDVAPGPPEGFSLGADDLHFVTALDAMTRRHDRRPA